MHLHPLSFAISLLSISTVVLAIAKPRRLDRRADFINGGYPYDPLAVIVAPSDALAKNLGLNTNATLLGLPQPKTAGVIAVSGPGGTLPVPPSIVSTLRERADGEDLDEFDDPLEDDDADDGELFEDAAALDEAESDLSPGDDESENTLLARKVTKKASKKAKAKRVAKSKKAAAAAAAAARRAAKKTSTKKKTTTKTTAHTTKTTSKATPTATTVTVPANSFNYGVTPVRGVNLGAWLVAEAWMVPSLYASANDSRVIDEWTMGQYLGRAAATALLTQHWQTWITEDDFAQIASYGLNHVRIPVGYWALDISQGEPYVQGSYDYLLQGIVWAKKYGLKVLVDLHGAPGSQNGYDNSGRQGDVEWASAQLNIQRTTNVLLQMAKQFSQPQYADVVTAIEVLNEPASYKSTAVNNEVKPWYYTAYQAIRFAGTSTPNALEVVIHDAFKGLTAWTGYMPSPKWQNVLLDTHNYANFHPTISNYNDVQLAKYWCKQASGLATSNKNLKTIVGEWTPPRTDCAGLGIPSGVSNYANAYGTAACQGKTGALGALSPATITGLRKSFEVQTQVYEENTSGWIAWAWKLEKAIEWSYSAGVQGGWIPTDPTQRIYGNQCA